MKIGFGCEMGTGKDECVKYLLEKYGGQKITFSKYLYDILNYAQEICGFPKEKDRKFLQWIGTDWAREKNQNVWIELTLKYIKENKDKNLYCSDIRFVNELNALKDDGWVCVKVNRKRNIDDLNKRSGTGSFLHQSETEFFDLDKEWDYIIDNNGTLEELHTKIDNIIENLKE